MPEKANKPAKKPGSWSAARQHLATWEKSALLALVKDLYTSDAGNRDFIHARCQAEDDGGEVLEKYRKKVIGQFFSNKSHGMGDLKLGEARKAIRDYKKATGSIPGTTELLMTYVESGARFTQEYGDIGERFYSRVESALDDWLDCCVGKRPICIHNSANDWRRWSEWPTAAAGAFTISSLMWLNDWVANSANHDTG